MRYKRKTKKPSLTLSLKRGVCGGGKSGVASIYRLNNERYGMKADRQLMLYRSQKEVIHELGHTFGLVHCLNPECVMRSSTYVEDIDQKGFHLCRNCIQKLNNA